MDLNSQAQKGSTLGIKFEPVWFLNLRNLKNPNFKSF